MEHNQMYKIQTNARSLKLKMGDQSCLTLNEDTDLICSLENWLEVRKSLEPSKVKVLLT